MITPKITLKEIPVNRDDEESLTYSYIGGDRCFEFVGDGNITLGHVFITEDTETPNGIPCRTYINWIELLTIYRGRGLFRPMMEALANMFGVLHLEASEGTNVKYRSIGAESLGMDDFTELEIFRYKGD